ncbi:MAG: hypothetical protein K0S15_1816 [Solirubrobacterales bacterium]|nr:hypothetical protein [Solirubrobacterales bacterium]
MESSQSGVSGGGSVMDGVQKAIEDLRSAGEKATGDVRSNIDSAVARLRNVSGEATKRGQGAELALSAGRGRRRGRRAAPVAARRLGPLVAVGTHPRR